MARRMSDVVRAVHPLLRESGFTKRRNTFNRETEPGLVHVIAFQMGRYELYGEQHDPFTGEYGRFWLALGVYVAEVAELLGGSGRQPEFIVEPQCELRVQADSVSSAPRAGWYLGEEHDALVEEARTALTGGVLPYLDRLTTRDALLAAWDRDPLDVPLTRDKLAAAAVELGRGRRERGFELVREHLADGNFHPRHADWVRANVLPRIELKL